MQINKMVTPLRFWCYKIIPLVYDNSLSYYESLCKIREKLNEVIKVTNDIPEYIDEKVKEAFDDEHIAELISEIFRTIEDAITDNNESTNTNFSKDYEIGELLWHDNKLYEVIRHIDAGDAVLVDTNIELRDFESLFSEFVETVKYNICSDDEGTSPTATSDWDVGKWLWLNNHLYIVTRHIDQGDAFVYTGNYNVKAVTIETQTEMVYSANDKKLTIHGKIDDYHDIVESGDYHVYSPTREAIEIRKV